MLDNYRDILSVEEVRHILRIGKNKTYELLKNGTIPSRRYGKKYFITKNDIIDLIENNN